MALRPFFKVGSGDKFYYEEYIEFEFFSGFSITQKQKSIDSMHKEILKKEPNAKILEVSRKGNTELGNKLSAFNLKLTINDEFVPVENVFQSSKKFDKGGPFIDLLHVLPKDAKRDERLKNSGKLVSFYCYGRDWPLEPKSFFYDWIYISALAHDRPLCESLLSYDTFTDIEFNPKKSFNCQARSVAIFVTLMKQNKVKEFLTSLDKFHEIYKGFTPSLQLQ